MSHSSLRLTATSKNRRPLGSWSGTGNAFNVVLLHDGLLHSVTWDDVWQPLCAKYHVLRYDRRGYGRSDAATAPYLPEDDLLALMEKASMVRAVLAGNSKIPRIFCGENRASV